MIRDSNPNQPNDLDGDKHLESDDSKLSIAQEGMVTKKNIVMPQPQPVEIDYKTGQEKNQNKVQSSWDSTNSGQKMIPPAYPNIGDDNVDCPD